MQLMSQDAGDILGLSLSFSWSGHVSLSDKMSPGSQVTLVVMLLNRCLNKEGGVLTILCVLEALL